MVIPRLYDTDVDRPGRQFHGKQRRQGVNAELDVALHVDDHPSAVLQVAHVQSVRVGMPGDEVGGAIDVGIDGYLLLHIHLGAFNPNTLVDVDFDVAVHLDLFTEKRSWYRAVLREVQQQPLLRVGVGSRALIGVSGFALRHTFAEDDGAGAGHPAFCPRWGQLGMERWATHWLSPVPRALYEPLRHTKPCPVYHGARHQYLWSRGCKRGTREAPRV